MHACADDHGDTSQDCDMILLIIGGGYAEGVSDGVCDAIRGASEEKRVLTYLLVLGSPGLILVDHIHFQYNGMLLGKPGVDD
jgi:hypothetical protein